MNWKVDISLKGESLRTKRSSRIAFSTDFPSRPAEGDSVYYGIHPTKFCLARLRWAAQEALPNLLSAVYAGICPGPLYEAAVLDNPLLIIESRQVSRRGC